MVTGTTGSLDANGGGGEIDSFAVGGGGAGGRVAVAYVSDTSSFLSGLTAAGVATGGTGQAPATNGSTGTLVKTVYTAPAQPTVDSPGTI